MTEATTTRILATVTVIGLVSTALIVSTRHKTKAEQVTFDTRWNNAVSDFEKVRAPIPYEQLHNHALERLRSRIVAKDEAAAQ